MTREEREGPKGFLTLKDAEFAVERLSSKKFFPSDVMARKDILRTLIEICDGPPQRSKGKDFTAPERLEWLVNTIRMKVPEWPDISQVGALYATRFQPGNDEFGDIDCNIPGYTPNDGEARAIEADQMRSLKAYDEYRRQLRDGDVTADRELNAQVKALAERKKLQ